MSLNKVMLIGHIGKEPNIRYLDSGVCTASFSLATSTPSYILPNGTQVPERTEWHNILLWKNLAEYTERYIHKGDKVYIEGEIRTRKYVDTKGITKSITEIWAKDLQLLYSKTMNLNKEDQNANT